MTATRTQPFELHCAAELGYLAAVGKRNEGTLTYFMDLAGVGQKGLAEPAVIGESTLKKWIAGIPPASYEIRKKVYTKLAGLLIKNAQEYKRRSFEEVLTQIHDACEPVRVKKQSEPSRDELWPTVKACCDENIKRYIERHAKAGDEFYVKRAVEYDIDRFLAGEKTAMVIIGQSGMGKSTLLVHVLREKLAAGHLCFFISSAGLPTPVADVERHIVDRLLEAHLGQEDFWSRIDAECQARGKRLLIGIDAINEYDGAGTQRALAMEFLLKLDELVSRAHKATPNVRYLVTSRPETWRRGAENERVRQTGGAYYVTNGKPAYQLGRFTDAEAREAYDKYTSAYCVATPREEITELTKYHLRDPLLLKLICELNRDKGIPRELDTSQLFEEYDRRIREQALTRGANVGGVINSLVKQMFGAAETSYVILRDAVALDWMDINSTGFFLIDQSVIRVDVDLVRFVYDRYAEYLLSGALIEKIYAVAVHSDLAQAAFLVLKANLPGAQKLDTVFGALRRTLRVLQIHCTASDYATLVQRLATDSEHGMTLVASVMAALAMSQVGGRQGIDTLSALLQTLMNDNNARPMVAFPVIDAVYRVLLDEEYRTWLHSTPAAQAHHLAVLDDNFVRGIASSRDEIWAATIQYLFFLWQAPEAQADATRITMRIVESVSGGSRLLQQGWLIRNVANLLLLICAEARDEDTARDIFRLTKPLLQRLPIGPVSEFIVKQLVKSILDWLLSALPNPVDLSAVQGVFHDLRVRQDLGLVIHLLRPETNWEWNRIGACIPEIAKSENGIVLELLSVALSTRYESLRGEARERHLAMIESLFFTGSPPPVTEYVCALALYHINYFGAEPTSQSISLMGRMAERILERHGSEFTIKGKKYSFHIIGTYGRVMQRHRDLLLGMKENSGVPLLFAIRALEDAKRRQQFDYYRYICDNIGLLGILARPEHVFDVISHILADLRDTPRVNQEALPFPFQHVAEREAIRESVLSSLANIRVLYKPDVDRYLLDVLDDQRLFTEVAMKRRPTFDLAMFYSWTCDHLIFSLITRYYDEVGREVLDTLEEGFTMKTLGSAAQLFVARLFNRLTKLAQ